VRVTIRYFAGHRDITGKAEEPWELDAGATVGMLWEQLIARYPRLAGYGGRMLYAVNEEWSTLASELHDGDEVAFIPPVSGGASSDEAGRTNDEGRTTALFRITRNVLDPAPLVAAVQSPDMGAVVTFAGIVRNNFGGRATAHLEYEAYEAMAVAVLEQLAAEARAQWKTGAIAIHHRVGRLEIGETAVLIVVAAPHRHEAFEAAEQIMDRIKEIAPIWKKEIWADGESEWVGDERESRRMKAEG
jgi:molybdopterin converting factor subunit 1